MTRQRKRNGDLLPASVPQRCRAPNQAGPRMCPDDSSMPVGWHAACCPGRGRVSACHREEEAVRRKIAAPGASGDGKESVARILRKRPLPAKPGFRECRPHMPRQCTASEDPRKHLAKHRTARRLRPGKLDRSVGNMSGGTRNGPQKCENAVRNPEDPRRNRSIRFSDPAWEEVRRAGRSARQVTGGACP